MNTYDDRLTKSDSDLSSLSGSTHTSSMSKEEPSLREINDTRLVQALHYLNDEGGDDPPDRYIKRVREIHQEIVQRLLYTGRRGDYDIALHQHLKAVVRNEIEAFNVAVYCDPSEPESEDEASEEHSPEYHPTYVTPALYRRDEGLDGPISSLPAEGEIDYKNLTLNDIRARLQLPTMPEEVEKGIRRWCTAEQIEKVVEEFKRHDEGEEFSKDHTLGAFSNKLMLEKQGDLTDIRHAVNASPTKLRASLVRSTSQSATSTIHATREQVLKAVLDTSTGGKTSLGKPPSNAIAPSSIARKIDRSRTISLKNSPRRQSGVSTAPPSAEITPTEAAILQQGPDSNRAPNTSVKGISQSANTSADVDIPKPSSSKKARRKRSIGEQAYTPEKKRKKSAVPSSLKKPGGAPLETPERSVRFMSEDSDDVSSDSTIAIRESKPKKSGSKRTPKPAVKASPKRKTTLTEKRANGEGRPRPSLLPAKSILPSKIIRIRKKDSKATAAGKAVRNTFVKGIGVEEVAESRSARSAARSRK